MPTSRPRWARCYPSQRQPAATRVARTAAGLARTRGRRGPRARVRPRASGLPCLRATGPPGRPATAPPDTMVADDAEWSHGSHEAVAEHAADVAEGRTMTRAAASAHHLGPVPLGALERQVMEVLWDDGDLTVRELISALGDVHAYTTIATVLSNLDRKD